MALAVNSVYVAGDRVDIESGLAVLEQRGPEGLIADAPGVHLLGWGWDRPATSAQRPWEIDAELRSLLFDGDVPRFNDSGEELAALRTHDTEVANRYRDYVLQSAVRWLENLAWLLSGQDSFFDAELATRISVEPRGTLVLVPEHFSPNLTASTIYGEIIEAVGVAFPGVAAAAGAYSLDRCLVQVRVMNG